MIDRLSSWLVEFAGFDIIPLTAILAIVFGAAFFRGLTGFGYAILSVPLIGLIAPPETAVLMAILMQLVIGPFGARTAYRLIDRRMVGVIALIACATTPLGLWLLDVVSADVARIIITTIAIGSFFLFMLRRPAALNRSPPILLGVGALSGLLNGFAAMPGPPVILHFVRKQVPPAVARGSMIMIFFATAAMGTVVAFWRGMIDPPLLILSALACPLMIAGNHLGARYFGAVSEPVWRGFVLLLLAVAAAMALLRLLQ